MNDHANHTALAVDLVAAFVSNNSVSVGEVPGLIRNVFDAIEDLSAPKKAPEVLEPAVSIRASVRPDAVTCLECGYEAQMLRRHLGNAHNLTPEQYRARWGLKHDHPLTSPDYSVRRAGLAVKHGLGRKKGA